VNRWDPPHSRPHICIGLVAEATLYQRQPPQGRLKTWEDELGTPREVEVVGICSVSLSHQQDTCDARDGPELWSLQDTALNIIDARLEANKIMSPSAKVCGIATVRQS
jgi:hypothetical protein